MYATLADLLEQIPENDLISLTDDGGLGMVDTVVVERSIVNAQTMIDSYCQERFVVPMDPVPELARLLACDLALYNVYSRRGHVEIPEAIKDRQKQALAYLKRVQDGMATIGGARIVSTVGENQAEMASAQEWRFPSRTGGF